MNQIIITLEKLKKFFDPSIIFLSAARRSILPVSFAILNIFIVWFILTTSQAQDMIQEIEINKKLHLGLVSYTFLWSSFIFLTSYFSLKYSRIYTDETQEEIRLWCDKMIQKLPISLVLLQIFLMNYVFFNQKAYFLLINIFVISIISLFFIYWIDKKVFKNKIKGSADDILALLRIDWKKTIIEQVNGWQGVAAFFIVFFTVIFLIVCVLFIFFAQSISPLFNPLSVVIIAASFWLFPSLLLSLSSGRYRIPSYTIFVIYVYLISYVNNNHQIRKINNAESKNRPTDIKYVQDWVKRLIKEENAIGYDSTTLIPIYLIAAEGGGMRAAHWTGNLLSKFDSLDNRFYKRTLALSGVSGSSIGISFFQGLKKQNNGNITKCMNKLTNQDYLTPLLVGFFFPDMVQRFFPYPFESSDRVRYLEDSFSTKFNEISYENTLDSPFLEVCPTDKSSSPMILFNSTEVETGRKALISNVKLTDSYFHDVVDVIHEIESDMPMKTAATNSARFPIVTPPGMLCECKDKSSSLVDGGYFENTGLHSTFQLLRILQDNIEEPDRGRIEPRIIFLKNGESSLNQKPVGNLYEWSPFFAFINAWDRKSITIEYDINKITPEMFYGVKISQKTIALDRIGNNKNIPLGWTLSDEAINKMNSQIPKVIAEYDKTFK